MTSTSELEREAELRRAEMADTAEQLRAKLTPGQLIDELTHTFRDGDWGAAFTNLKTQVRDNPLALALVGAGVACLMAGVPGSQPHHQRTTSATRPSDRDSSSGIGEMASSAYHGIEENLSVLGESATSAGASFSEHLSDGASAMADATRSAGRHSRDAYGTVHDELGALHDREPLILGAVGVALGAAIGALLPATGFEKKHLAGVARQARHAGSEAVHNVADKAQDVVAAAGQAAMKEADRQGLMPDDDAEPIADRLRKVADRATSEARDALAGKDKQTGTDPEKSSDRPGQSHLG